MLRRRLYLLLLPAMLGGCGTDFESVDAVAVQPTAVSIWSVGGTATLSAQASTVDGTALIDQPTFAWSSSDPGVATVDAAGTVTAAGDGEVVITATAEGVSGQATVTVNTSGVTVSGHIRYQDKEYSPIGFNASKIIYKPVRSTLVDLIDASGNIVDTVTTDAQGYYTLGPFVPAEASLRVLAKTDAASGIDVEISDVQGSLYAVTSSLAGTSDGDVVDIDVPHSSIAGAFNALDVMSSGIEFIGSLAGAYPPALSVFWQPNNSLGTYYCTATDYSYCPQGEGIYVYNAGAYGDTDEFDDDVLWHEFGHFIAERFSRDDSTGGCHLLSSNDLDLRLAWSEGWGDFFPGAIKSWLAATPETAARLSTAAGLAPSYYIDTSGSGTLIAIDMGSPGSDPYVYAANEVAIANILWQLSQTFGMQAVWNVAQNYLPSVATPVNLEAFWDGWLSLNAVSPTQLANLQNIFGGRKIYYREDAFEADNDLPGSRAASLGVEEIHYLYQTSGAGDRDVVTFDATAGTTYRIETYGLRNGADTFLRLRDSAGTEVVSNDDYSDTHYAYDSLCGDYRYRNTTTALASRIDFAATATGTYTVEVSGTPDPEPYPSTGRYGSYSLKISAP